MNRQQRRYNERKEQKSKTKTYNLNEDQFKERVRLAVRKELEEHQEELINETTNSAMVLLLTLPLEVLMDHYWTKSYRQRIPEFTKYVLEYYERWQNGELNMDKLEEDLWEYGGVRLEVEE